MSTLTPWNNLQVVTPEPVVSGGKAINDNFKILSTPVTAADPGMADDDLHGFAIGSRWYNTSSNVEWICTNAATMSAVWVKVAGNPFNQSLNTTDSPTFNGLNLNGALDLTGHAINMNTGGGTGGGTLNMDAGNISNVGTLTTSGANHLQLTSTGINRAGSGNLTLILSPLGMGAIQVDSGGNTRGGYAVDLQSQRAIATQVASGLHSLVAGRNCTASGQYSLATGLTNTASGYCSTATGYSTTASGNYAFATGISTLAGGLASTAVGYGSSASNYYSFAHGYFTIASGGYSQAGGLSTIASGYNSVARGFHSTASSNYSTASGIYSIATAGHSTVSGRYSTASGNYSTASGCYSTASGFYAEASGLSCIASGAHSRARGRSSTASGNYSSASGVYALASKFCQIARNSFTFSEIKGDNQETLTHLGYVTTNATQAELTLDGDPPSGTTEPTSNRFLITSLKSYGCVITVLARAANGTTAFFIRQVVAMNVSGSVSVGTITTIGADTDPNSWGLVIQADNTNKSLQILVTGAASTTIEWRATVRADEIYNNY